MLLSFGCKNPASLARQFSWSYTPQQIQKDASYVKLPAISGEQFPNDALLSRYKSAKDGGALISPQQPRISSSGQSSTGRLTLLDILSASVGCNTLHLASKVVCKGIPLDPFLTSKSARRNRFALHAALLVPLYIRDKHPCFSTRFWVGEYDEKSSRPHLGTTGFHVQFFLRIIGRLISSEK